MTPALHRLTSAVILGMLLMPSPRIWSHKRLHRNHATCEHHLRRHHPDPEDRARVLRRAARREQRRLERAQAEEARRLAMALDESALQTTQAAADPSDDDSTLKKQRRRAKKASRFWSLVETPRIRPAGCFLAMLRSIPEVAAARLEPPPLQPHYGSGPCHSIPRPREGTTLPDCRLAA